MQGVDAASAEAQKFMESYERLSADFENFAGEISFADPLELKAMWENRAYWEQRLAALPPIPKQQKLKALPMEEPTQKIEGAEPAPEAPRKARSATMHSAHSSARHSSRPSQVSGPPPSRASAPSLRTIRQQEYQEAPSRPSGSPQKASRGPQESSKEAFPHIKTNYSQRAISPKSVFGARVAPLTVRACSEPLSFFCS